MEHALSTEFIKAVYYIYKPDYYTKCLEAPLVLSKDALVKIGSKSYFNILKPDNSLAS